MNGYSSWYHASILLQYWSMSLCILGSTMCPSSILKTTESISQTIQSWSIQKIKNLEYRWDLTRGLTVSCLWTLKAYFCTSCWVDKVRAVVCLLIFDDTTRMQTQGMDVAKGALSLACWLFHLMSFMGSGTNSKHRRLKPGAERLNVVIRPLEGNSEIESSIWDNEKWN